MLFRKKMEHRCSYCIQSTRLDEDQVLCIKKGVRNADSKCLKFKYDPTKRIPVKAKVLDFSKYDQEDYSL